MNIRGCSSVGESNLASVKYPLLEGLGERRKIGRVKLSSQCAMKKNMMDKKEKVIRW